MTTAAIPLDAQLTGQVFPFLMVFTRFGAALMLFPGIGESFVPARTRMMFALALSFLAYPVLMTGIPRLPDETHDLVRLIASEGLIGVFFGMVLRLLMSAIELAGSIVAMQLGLSNAMILNPALAAQSTLPSALLGMIAVVLVFVTGLDHLLLRGLFGTYELFPAGGVVPSGDIAQSYTRFLSGSFQIGLEMAMPFVIVGLLLYAVLGLMQRMVQQVQLFLVILPFQIWGGFFLFSATISAMLIVWIRYFNESFSGLFVR